MDVNEIAQRVSDQLSHMCGEALIGVAYFSPDNSSIVFLREDINNPYPQGETSEELLDHALLESVATPMYERVHNQRLVATTRVYENVVDTTVLLGEHEGVLFGIERDEVDYLVALATVEDTVQECGRFID